MICATAVSPNVRAADMDFTAASALVDHIAGCCGGYWEPSTREAWIEAMLGVKDARHAEDAARTLGVRWTGNGRPAFSDFMQLYDSSKRQEMMRPALNPGPHDKVALLDHLLLLTIRAEEGDKAARTEVENWRKMLAPAMARVGGMPRKQSPHRPRLLAALPGIDEAAAYFAATPDPLFDTGEH